MSKKKKYINPVKQQRSTQELSLLAVIQGSIITIEQENLGGKAASTITYIRERGDKLVASWPVYGNEKMACDIAFYHCRIVQKTLDASSDRYSALLLGMLSQELLIAIHDKPISGEKLEILRELLESINACVDIYDPGEKEAEVRAEAQRICGVVRKQVEY